MALGPCRIRVIVGLHEVEYLGIYPGRSVTLTAVERAISCLHSNTAESMKDDLAAK
jgi:hypothetical protein